MFCNWKDGSIRGAHHYISTLGCRGGSLNPFQTPICVINMGGVGSLIALKATAYINVVFIIYTLHQCHTFQDGATPFADAVVDAWAGRNQHATNMLVLT